MNLMTTERWKQLHDPDLLSVAPYFRFKALFCADRPACAALNGRAWHHTDPKLPKLPCGQPDCSGTFYADSAKSLARKGIKAEIM